MNGYIIGFLVWLVFTWCLFGRLMPLKVKRIFEENGTFYIFFTNGSCFYYGRDPSYTVLKSWFNARTGKTVLWNMDNLKGIRKLHLDGIEVVGRRFWV